MENIELRFASSSDVSLILSMIRELAEAEGLADQVAATEQILKNSLFGENAVAQVLLAYSQNAPIGYAIFCPKFATYTGRNEIYLQDMYVRPSFQRKGVGTMLMTRISNLALKRGASRVEWFVLDTNSQALSFYAKLGAKVIEPIKVSRLEGNNLKTLAEKDR